MTQEEKQILITDLCGRVPYVTFVYVNWHETEELEICEGCEDDEEEPNIHTLISCNYYGECDLDDNLSKTIYDIKPYLRPISSMTDKEKEELKEEHKKDERIYAEVIERIANGDEHAKGTAVPHFAADWCNKNQFDYRGLIPMGLALEAPEGMYNKEESEEENEIPIPKTVDEAVKTLAKILSKEDRDYLLENGAISMHNSLGRWIRNEWGLWTGSELKDELMNMNKGLNHPDDMSNYIIEEFIKYWNNKS